MKRRSFNLHERVIQEGERYTGFLRIHICIAIDCAVFFTSGYRVLRRLHPFPSELQAAQIARGGWVCGRARAAKSTRLLPRTHFFLHMPTQGVRVRRRCVFIPSPLDLSVTAFLRSTIPNAHASFRSAHRGVSFGRRGAACGRQRGCGYPGPSNVRVDRRGSRVVAHRPFSPAPRRPHGVARLAARLGTAFHPSVVAPNRDASPGS